VVEDTDDPAVADEYYDFYLGLMRRKGRRPVLARDAAPALLASEKGRCAVRAAREGRRGRLLAVGLFPTTSASCISGAAPAGKRAYAVPQRLHALGGHGLGADRGLRLYNMSAREVQRKFGGELTAVARWHKCYWRTARWARKGYQLWAEKSAVRTIWRRPRRAQRGHADRAGAAELEIVTTSQRPAFRPSDIFKAPLHDFPIRDEILYHICRSRRTWTCSRSAGQRRHRVPRRPSAPLADAARHRRGEHRPPARDARGPAEPQLRVRRRLPARARAQLGRTFDAAYAIEVFELLPDPEQCLRNFAEVLRPGGQLLLQFPNYPPSLSRG